MGELWERWWPTVLGIALLGTAGFFFWPDADGPGAALEQPPAVAEPSPATLPSSATEARGADLDRQRLLEEARQRSLLRGATDEPPAGPERNALPEPDAVGRDEPNRAVTLTQDSPEVQRVLPLIEVELYETAWCQYCKKTRAFLDGSGINYRAYDVEADETAKLRKDRLAPGRGVPLTVIDGEALYGFSEAALNAAFQAAIKRRLAGR
jgi:glutaredoxin